MITITKQPGNITLSRNPMIVEILATNADGGLYTAQGVRSELRDSSTVGISDGNVLTLNWTEPNGATGTLSFTAQDAPSQEDHIPTKNTPGIGFSVSDYWNAVAAAIQAHPDIYPYFRVYRIVNSVGSSYSLWIEAKEIDTDWSLSWDDGAIASGSFAVYDYPTTAGNTAPDNYRILVDVLFEADYLSGQFERIAKLELSINQISRAYLDLSNIIHPALKKAMPELGIPSFAVNTPFRAGNLRRYYLRYREKYDEDATSWSKTTTRLAMCGGIAQNLFSTYDFFGNLKDSNALLTYYPSGKTVSSTQPEWIGWYNYDDSIHDALLEVRTWTTDSQDPVIIYRLAGNGVSISPMETLLIPTGPNQLSIGDQVVKYEVRVIDQVDYDGSTITYLSQSRTYYIDRRLHREQHYLMYLNSFCLPETVRCLGEFLDDLEVDRKIVLRPLPPDYSEAAAQVWQYDQDFANRFTYRTGYLSRAEVDALQELLIYNDAYEVFQEGYIRLHITNNRYEIYDSSEYLMSHVIRAEPRLKRENYGNVLIPMSIEQDNWQEESGDYWLNVFIEPWENP